MGGAASKTEPLDDVVVPLAHSEQSESVGQDVEFGDENLLRFVRPCVVDPHGSA